MVPNLVQESQKIEFDIFTVHAAQEQLHAQSVLNAMKKLEKCKGGFTTPAIDVVLACLKAGEEGDSFQLLKCLEQGAY